MKRIISLLFLSGSLITVSAQDSLLARLPIMGSVSELGISPSEAIWIATKAGEVYHTPSIDSLWHFSSPGGRKKDPFDSENKVFERINVLGEDTMIISGFISPYDFVYWSGDHGKSWQKIKFGKDSWIDAAYSDRKGKVWMSGSSQLIYYTEDGGKTWQSFPRVERTGNMRFSTIFFAKNGQTGLFGSFWDAIYRTTDNCRSWQKLASPLAQQAYTQLSAKERPDIRKIRMFGSFYIVNQQGRVFMSKSDFIEWRPLPGIADFEVSDQENLYVINKDKTVACYSPEFSQLWHSGSALDEFPEAIAVRNEQLFALAGEKIYKITKNGLSGRRMFTRESAIEEPYRKITFNGITYGFDHTDILRYDKSKKRWYRFMGTDQRIANAFLFKNNLLITDENYEDYFQVDLKHRSLKKYTLPARLFPATCKVVACTFSTGSDGCFHSEERSRIYRLQQDNRLVPDKKSDTGYLQKMPSVITEDRLQRLIRVLDSSRHEAVTAAALQCSAKDITVFKDFIRDTEQKIKKEGYEYFDHEGDYTFHGEHTDFSFYRDMADNIEKVPDTTIKKVFGESSGNWSTTTNWNKITFTFQDGKELVLMNTDDKPNYLYLPWMATYDGVGFKINSIRFGKLIDELTAGTFIKTPMRDKNYALFNIVDYLYLEQQEKQ